MNKKPYLRYLGGGALPNVPARNLTKQEFDSFDFDTQAAILACGLYELTAKKGK